MKRAGLLMKRIPAILFFIFYFSFSYAQDFTGLLVCANTKQVDSTLTAAKYKWNGNNYLNAIDFCYLNKNYSNRKKKMPKLVITSANGTLQMVHLDFSMLHFEMYTKVLAEFIAKGFSSIETTKDERSTYEYYKSVVYPHITLRAEQYSAGPAKISDMGLWIDLLWDNIPVPVSY